ncbi:MAG TPA: hypothetical protein VIL74_03515 [Pyrinomonadaceae bacterium]|jgi:hypothetical protein
MTNNQVNQSKVFASKSTKTITTFFLVCVLASQSFAQIFQSSGFIPFNENRPTTANVNPNIERGKGYLTIKMVDGRVYDDNPGIRFWKKNRKLVSLFTTEGVLGTLSLNQGRGRTTESPGRVTFDTIKNGTPYSLNWNNIILVDEIPCDFSSLTLTSKVNTTSENGFDDVFNAMQTITGALPNLTVNAATQGILTGTKSVVDLLVRDKLDQSTINATQGITYGMRTGYYVNFASQNPAAWSKYQLNAQNLFMRSGRLMYFDGTNEVPVDKVSYIILEIGVTEPWKEYDTFNEWRANVFALERNAWQANFNQAYTLSLSGDMTASEPLRNNVRRLIENGKRSLREDSAVSTNDKVTILNVVDTQFPVTSATR